MAELIALLSEAVTRVSTVVCGLEGDGRKGADEFCNSSVLLQIATPSTYEDFTDGNLYVQNV